MSIHLFICYPTVHLCIYPSIQHCVSWREWLVSSTQPTRKFENPKICPRLPQKIEKMKMFENPLVAAKVRKNKISKTVKLFENCLCQPKKGKPGNSNLRNCEHLGHLRNWWILQIHLVVVTFNFGWTLPKRLRFFALCGSVHECFLGLSIFSGQRSKHYVGSAFLGSRLYDSKMKGNCQATNTHVYGISSHMSMYLCISLYLWVINLSACLPACLSVCPFIRPSIHPSIPIHLAICLSLSIYLIQRNLKILKSPI